MVLNVNNCESIFGLSQFFPHQAGEMEVHNPLFQDDPTPKAKWKSQTLNWNSLQIMQKKTENSEKIS